MNTKRLPIMTVGKLRDIMNENKNLKTERAQLAECLRDAIDLWDGTNELCDEVHSPEWLWLSQAQRLLYDIGEKEV